MQCILAVLFYQDRFYCLNDGTQCTEMRAFLSTMKNQGALWVSLLLYYSFLQLYWCF
jgi:hypothetical protein